MVHFGLIGFALVSQFVVKVVENLHFFREAFSGTADVVDLASTHLLEMLIHLEVSDSREASVANEAGRVVELHPSGVGVEQVTHSELGILDEVGDPHLRTPNFH